MYKVITREIAHRDIVGKIGEVSALDESQGYTVYETRSQTAVIIHFWHTSVDTWEYLSDIDAMPYMIELAKEMRSELELLRMNDEF